MIFQEKCFSCYILLTDQFLLSDCLYLLRYWAIYALQLFASQVVTLKTLKLKSDSHLPKNLCYLFDLKPFKNDEKCFLLHLKKSFRSQVI